MVPEGLLFRETQSYVTVRKSLVEHFTIHAVIALHEFVFRPYTGQPTAILILTKGNTKKPVWFYDVVEDGFEKTSSKDGRPPCLDGDNDLVTLRRVWDEQPDSENSFRVPLTRIRENLYKLSLSSYRQRSEKPDWMPLGGKDGVCDILLGGTPKTAVSENWRKGNHPWATISDMGDRYVMKTDRKITDLGVQHSNVKLLPKGTVLVSFKLTIGKVAIAGIDLYTNEAIAGLVPKDERVLPEYLYYLIPALDLRSYMQPAAKGKTLNKKIIESIRIPIPSPMMQQRFIDKMNKLETETLKFKEKAKTTNQDIVNESQTFLAKN